jgi:hypothetical protein
LAVRSTPVREPGESQQSVRLGRCANHAAMPAVGACDVCGKAICVSCAIPVRGKLVCHDCLGTVLEDVPATSAPPERLPLPGRGDAFAAMGFGLVVVLSVFPWTRFGDRSGFLEAWLPHWSLIAVGAATAGLVFAVRTFRRPLDPRVVASVYVALGLVVGAASILHRRHPPGAPLATAGTASRLALLGAAIALAGGLAKGASMLRSPRPAP